MVGTGPGGVTYCKRHPHVESNLGCSRCGDLICPQCLIQTPVGARCPECANVRSNPLVTTSSIDLTRAIAAGVGTAVVLSAIVYLFLVPAFGGFGLLMALAAPAAIGYAVGEAIYRAAGYRRNNTLAWVAGISVLVGFAALSYVAALLSISTFATAGIFGILIGVYLAVRRVRL